MARRSRLNCLPDRLHGWKSQPRECCEWAEGLGQKHRSHKLYIYNDASCLIKRAVVGVLSQDLGIQFILSKGRLRCLTNGNPRNKNVVRLVKEHDRPMEEVIICIDSQVVIKQTMARSIRSIVVMSCCRHCLNPCCQSWIELGADTAMKQETLSCTDWRSWVLLKAVQKE